MTKRVIDLRTEEEKAAWIFHRKIEDEAIAIATEAMAKTLKREADVTGVCPRCSNPANADEDTCPFHLEIHDEDISCKCCENCRDQCALDI